MSVEGLRYAHCEGRVCVEYSRNGAKIHTLGLDGEMRVWAGIDDDDCENIVVGEEGLAMAVATDRLVLFLIQASITVTLNYKSSLGYFLFFYLSNFFHSSMGRKCDLEL